MPGQRVLSSTNNVAKRTAPLEAIQSMKEFASAKSVLSRNSMMATNGTKKKTSKVLWSL